MPTAFRALMRWLLILPLVACAPGDISEETPGIDTEETSPAQAAEEPAAQRSPSDYVRAAHWFGSGWPVNFWNTRLESHAEADFRRMKDDGFNTVVIVVPWPGFAPDPHSGELDVERVARLRNFIRLADELQLGVILRVAFAWDALDPRAGSRLHQLWLDEATYRGWIDHLGSLWSAVGDEPNLLFGFFSWEDLWALAGLAEADRNTRLLAAGMSGFQSWLQQHYRLDEVSEQFRESFADWEQIPLPARREPAFRLLLHFIDHAWIERFFKPAQARFPRLSMEVRIDSDPVWDGDALLEWHSHAAAWDLPGAGWTTLYWSPSMGGLNRGEELSPQEAAKRLERSLGRVRDHTGGRPIFIGQFLAEDYTPGYELNGKVPKARIGEFLEAAAAPLQELAAGYGLWTWRDYAHDPLANPEFAAGLADWEHAGGVKLVADAVELQPGAFLQRTVSVHEYHAPGGPGLARFCIEGEAMGDAAAAMQLHDREKDVSLGELRLPPPPGSRDCLEIPVHDLMRLQLQAHAPARLRRASSMGFVQHSGMRDLDAEPKPVASAYRALNRRLQRATPADVPLHTDGWMGRSLSIGLPRPTGQSAELRFSTYLPPDWPVQPVLTIAIDGQHIDDIECVAGQKVSLPVAAGDESTAMLRLRIDASAVAQSGGDARPLGCLLSGLALIPSTAQHEQP